MTDHEDCPGCGHSLAKEVHDPQDGCLYGWIHDTNGLVIDDGCMCELTVAGQCR